LEGINPCLRTLKRDQNHRSSLLKYFLWVKLILI
jgi:hypothetical protein